jgi:hypothetical protein
MPSLCLAAVRKELRPVHDNVSCDVCGRTILKGERTEAFLAPGGQRRTVCELCFSRAGAHGWIRESTAGDLPARPARTEQRRSLLGRLRRRSEAPARGPGTEPPPYVEPTYGEQESWEAAALGPTEVASGFDEGVPLLDEQRPAPAPPRSRPKDPRHVRAVPSTPEGRVERALELFNESPHQRTTAGLARTLGTPWVTAAPIADQPSEVTVVVAWELSWYSYRVNLAEELEPVVPESKGEEIDEIDESLRDWNATLDEEGRLAISHAVAEGDER